MMRNNYDYMRNQARTQFLQYDQRTMIEKFSLQSDADYLYIRMLGRDYRIDRSNGTVVQSSDGFASDADADYFESMTIYDLLCCAKEDCHLAGRFAPLTGLKGVAYVGNSGCGTIFRDRGEELAANAEQVARACRSLGGVPEGNADAAFRIPVFDFLPVQVRFWEADEDFPAQIALLWDENTLAFLHFEAACYAEGILMKRLREQIL